MAATPERTDLSDAGRHGISAGPLAHILLLAVLAAAVGLVYWARDLTVVSVLRADGVVAPLGKVRRVLSPAGGTLEAHDIRTGLVVAEGQLLFRVERPDERADAEERESKTRALRAAIVRLEAEAQGAETVSFPEDIAGQSEAVAERNLFESRQADLERQREALRKAAAQAKLDIAERKADADRLQKAGDLAREELKVLEPLVERGISPKLESLRIQEKVQKLEAQRERATLAVPRLEAALKDTQRRLGAVGHRFQAEAQRELAERQAELASQRRELQAMAMHTLRSEIRAPIRGEVRRVFVGGAGTVVREGQEVIEIAPLVRELFVDARFPESAAGALRTGQAAGIAVNGNEAASAPGRLVAVEAPGWEDAEGRRFAAARLRVDADAPGFDRLRQTGLDVVVTVKTPVLLYDYLLGSLADARGGELPAIRFGR